ncbi:MAG: tetratricopeptide repeat protein [Gammaproteobacteria bacterium]|nr:tetratricopeptide repeat protein [Gammaproteobacteria bacterium]
MNDYMTEKEQLAQIKEWWQRSGKWLAVAVLVGLAIGFGYRYWKSYEVRQDEVASQLYQMVAVAQFKKQAGVAQQYVKQLQASHASSPYTAFAVLSLAQQQVNGKQYQQASQNLNWVVEYTPVKSLKQLARIRAAKILLSTKQYKKALKMLAYVDDKTFLPMIENVQGDIYRVTGDSKKADALYHKAKLGYAALEVANPIMLMQLSS